MKKTTIIVGLCFALVAGYALAHHPAADIVDAEIYAMIDSMVADTPHADIVFDDVMGTTTITTDSVSAAEALIDDGLLANLSLLDEDVTATITFGADVEPMLLIVSKGSTSPQWTERNDWGREVIITVDTLLE